MSVMEDREPPPPYFGDYPNGTYWSAVVPPSVGADDEESYTVQGSQLRVMWDEGAGPLWSEAGLLPEDPQWLQRALGLSDPLVKDLLTWLADMTAQRDTPSEGRQARMQQLHARGRDLAERVQGEVGSPYRVSYRG